jgi:hypothetical protein
MNNLIFAIKINAILEDGTEVDNAIGEIISDKRVYKLSDNTVLTNTKKIKTIKFATFTVPAELLPYIMSMENI